MGKVTSLIKEMSGHRVYIDTNVFIYFLDRSPVYFPIARQLMYAIDSGDITGITGDVTIAETLVKPYRTGNTELIAGIKGFFHAEGFLCLKPHDAETFDLAAQLRAKEGMKFIDALHYATAIRSGCTFFITNDLGIKTNHMLHIVSISSLRA